MRTNQSKLLIDNLLSRNDNNNFRVLKYLQIDRFISFNSFSPPTPNARAFHICVVRA